MTSGFAQLLTKDKYQKGFLGSKGRLARKADRIIAMLDRYLENLGSLTPQKHMDLHILLQD
jgi:hypothetical protein